jgi:hypothetical protein
MPGDKHFVLGNHCVHTLTKMEFLKEVEQQESFYSFDAGPISCLTTAQITASILGR